MRLLRWACAAAALSASCQVVGNYESFEAATAGEASSHPCDHPDLGTSKPDDMGRNTLVLTKKDDRDCFWIDRTEVTVADYRDFVLDICAEGACESNTESVLGLSGAEATSCAWKTDPSDPENSDDECSVLALADDPVFFGDTMPIRCVDWCDAAAYCKWAEKSLCASPPEIVLSTEGDATLDWGKGCAQWEEDETPFKYPYGDEFAPLACNIGFEQSDCNTVLQVSACGTTQVYPDSPLDCTSTNGATDMIGNVAEWTTNCSTLQSMPEEQSCETRGGSFAVAAGEAETITCETRSANWAQRSTRDPTIGFRCCDRLTTIELDKIGRP